MDEQEGADLLHQPRETKNGGCSLFPDKRLHRVRNSPGTLGDWEIWLLFLNLARAQQGRLVSRRQVTSLLAWKAREWEETANAMVRWKKKIQCIFYSKPIESWWREHQCLPAFAIPLITGGICSKYVAVAHKTSLFNISSLSIHHFIHLSYWIIHYHSP